MKTKFKPGDIIRHFKRDLIPFKEQRENMYLYRVVDIATHTETNEEILVYQALYYPFKTFVRPLSMALEKTPKERYDKNVQNLLQEFRFELYFEDEDNE